MRERDKKVPLAQKHNNPKTNCRQHNSMPHEKIWKNK
jgi:hypothetical protein